MKWKRQIVYGSQEKDFHVLVGPVPDKHQFIQILEFGEYGWGWVGGRGDSRLFSVNNANHS